MHKPVIWIQIKDIDDKNVSAVQKQIVVRTTIFHNERSEHGLNFSPAVRCH